MSEHITKQVNLSAAWMPTALVILALGLVPGMPNQLFLFFAAIAGVLAYLSRRKEQLLSNEVDEEQKSDSEEESSDFDVNSVRMHQKFL